MQNLNAPVIAVVTLLTIYGAGCTGSEKSKEFVALDKAYQEGVITKDEYEMKKAAFESQAEALAALNKALEAGVLNKDEYDARKARLDAKTGTLAALEKALRAGVLTKDEYLAKKAALLAADLPAPGTSVPGMSTLATHPRATPVSTTVAATSNASPVSKPAVDAAPRLVASDTKGDASLQAHTYRMKMIKVMDEHGFERPMATVSMLLPTDWQSQGATTWNVKDNCNTIQTTLHASGPDGRGFDVFPTYNWIWADDPRPLQQIFAQKAQLGAHACDVIAPMGATDYLRKNLARVRPGAQLVAIEPAPKLMQLLQQQARQAEQSAAQYKLQQRVRPDVIRARLKYSLNGRPVEEWLIVATIITGTLGPSYNAATNQQTQAFTYSCVANMTAERTPEGQLDSSEKFFELINSTYRVSEEWQRRVSGQALAVQQIELKGVRDRSAIVAKNADDIANIQRQGYENRQKSEDHVFGQISENTRGVETYRNPASGETIELSNQYGHAWVNNRGEYLLSDQAGFDPSVTFKEDWKPLEHVKP
jgi:hypothetical protein